MPTYERRRSERYAELLDERATGRRSHRHNAEDTELAPFVWLAGRVASLPDEPGPTDEFRTGLRAMLLAKIEREGVQAALSDDKTTRIPPSVVRVVREDALAGPTVPVTRPVRTGRTQRLRLVLLAGVTAGAVALSGVSAASTDALPGDALYQVKRSTEQAQLALAGSDQGRGALLLEFARQRLIEASKVRPERVALALAAMNQQIVEGVNLITSTAVQHGDLRSLDTVTTFVAQQLQLMDTFAAALAAAGDTVQSSRTLLDQVASRARGLAQGCPTHTADGLGPVPTTC